MSEFTLRIDGMHCGSCVRRVSQALSQTAGVTVKEVRVGAARLESEQQPAPVDEAIAALARAGYTAHPDPSGAPVSAGN
jgi:copper chaperone CopZ